jgi:hypothetical protein
MEKIIIDRYLYSCKNGTSKKLSDLLKEAEKSPPEKHENGTAYDAYNAEVEAVVSDKKGVFIDNLFYSV